MIGFTDCCHHQGRVKFVSAQLLRQTGAMEPAGVGGSGSVVPSPGVPRVWGREGELPQRCESVQALAYRGNLSPAGADFREV